MKAAESVISTETAPPAREEQKRLGYVPALDGVRGIAVLLVMGNHIPLRRFESLLPGGFAGVDIFFVLSGFLITTLLIQEFQRTGAISLRYFYFRRVLRLGPALLALLLTICILSFVLYDTAQARQNCLNALIALFYASNWVRVLTKNQLGLLAHTWSLSAEEQFYIFWPVILLALLRVSKRRSHIVAVASVIALLSWLAGIYLASRGASQRRLCFGLDSRGDTLMIGCILGVLLSSGLITQTRTVRKILLVMAPISLACLVAYSISGDVFGRGLFYYGFVLIALLAATVIFDVLANPQGITARIMSMKWLVWIGSISYGLYLWHWTIFWGMQGFGYSGWTIVLVGIPLTFAIVLLSYYGMEKPIINLKKRFHPGTSGSVS